MKFIHGILLSNLRPRRLYNNIVCFSTEAIERKRDEHLHLSPLHKDQPPRSKDAKETVVPPNYRFVYPEFLPDPKIEWRNKIREKLERMDMLDRRKHIAIPEFYVGSILSVTSSDPHADGKVSHFVGICIDRNRCGLRARFILRNVIDHQGVEVEYEMYDPTILSIEVLRLEKRLDNKLYYLRDALPEYSTFSLDMKPQPLPSGAKVPINDVKVILRPRPWLERWERQKLKGVANVDQYLTDKHRKTALQHETPWTEYDLMEKYRRTIPEEEQNQIYAEVHSEMHQMELTRKKNIRKQGFLKATELV